MLPRDFSFSLVFFRDLRGAKAAPEPPSAVPFMGKITRFPAPDTPKNKWKNDGMTGKNKCPKPPKKTGPRTSCQIEKKCRDTLPAENGEPTEAYPLKVILTFVLLY